MPALADVNPNDGRGPYVVGPVTAKNTMLF